MCIRDSVVGVGCFDFLQLFLVLGVDVWKGSWQRERHIIRITMLRYQKHCLLMVYFQHLVIFAHTLSPILPDSPGSSGSSLLLSLIHIYLGVI